jgi:hypothetical protein
MDKLQKGDLVVVKATINEPKIGDLVLVKSHKVALVVDVSFKGSSQHYLVRYINNGQQYWYSTHWLHRLDKDD